MVNTLLNHFNTATKPRKLFPDLSGLMSEVAAMRQLFSLVHARLRRYDFLATWSVIYLEFSFRVPRLLQYV